MFVPKFFFEKLLGLMESQYQLSLCQTENSLQRVLTAKDSEVSAVIAAKDAQLELLAGTIAELKESVSHERQRAEAAIDILLTRDGAAGPVRNADLIREVAEREASGETHSVPRPQKEVNDVLKNIFGQVNSVLSDDMDEDLGAKPDEVITMNGARL